MLAQSLEGRHSLFSDNLRVLPETDTHISRNVHDTQSEHSTPCEKFTNGYIL
jgi:hypothetical protein